MAIKAGFKTRGHHTGLRHFLFTNPFLPGVLAATAWPLHSVEGEPDFSGVHTHQGPRLAVWHSAFQWHKRSADLQIFYLTDNNQTGVLAWLHGAREKKILKQKVHANI